MASWERRRLAGKNEQKASFPGPKQEKGITTGFIRKIYLTILMAGETPALPGRPG
jgi:hypothetical protein